MSVVNTSSLVKRYETDGRIVVALDGVDLSVDAGEFVSIVGPSGSGKTTLLNILGLLDAPTSGSLVIEDQDAADLSERERTERRKRTIGFVFQQFHLLPTLSARENVEIPRLYDDSNSTRRRAMALLKQVGLGDRFGHHPSELSGGQKQRVAIARALVNEPSLVLADEPTGNLDRTTGRTILETFADVSNSGVAVIAVTHDPLVTEFTDRTVGLEDGKIVEDTFL